MQKWNTNKCNSSSLLFSSQLTRPLPLYLSLFSAFHFLLNQFLISSFLQSLETGPLQRQQLGSGFERFQGSNLNKFNQSRQKMLDLNVDVSYDEKTRALEADKLRGEDSGTSNSSVVNAEEDSYSNNTSPFIFDILRKDKHCLCNNREDQIVPSPEFSTRPLLPVTGDGGGGGRGGELGLLASSNTTSRPQWLNLSFAESGGQAELKVVQQKQQQARKSRRGPRSRSSQYRGVTFYRRTGRWESHIWDCGKQVYLGGFDTAHSAAKAYDRAAIKFRGVDADINFVLSDYEEDLKQMRHLNKEEFVHALRRQSNGASRMNSKFRGVAAAAAAAVPKIGPYEVRMGQLIPGNKLIKCNGREGVTNFDPSIYEGAVVVDASTEGSGHDLDLSLGISQPSTGQKRKAFEMLNKERPMVNGSASVAGGQPLHAIAMISKHPALYSEIYPGFLHKTEEMATDHYKRIQAVSSPRFSNWAWQMNGNNNNVTPMPMFSIAASSGFSSSRATVPPSVTNQLPILQDNSTYNLRHSFPTSL